MKLSGRRGSAVLDAPEESYASRRGGPRRAAAGLRRDLQEDFGRDFENGFGETGFAEAGFGEDSYGAEDFDSNGPVRRRAGVRVGVKRGLWGRVQSWMPQTLWGRIAAGTGAVVVLGLGVAGVMAVRDALLHDARFVVPSSSAIQIEGNQHVTKAQLLSIFGEDVDRNIFTLSLAERRAELERLPWVEHATVMRLLPDHIRVSLVERTPVAFVRQGGHIGLVDKSGVLMDMVSGAGAEVGTGAHYSFPVVTGIAASEPLSTRAARMKMYERFTKELDAGGETISASLSEVDLSDPEDVKALIPDDNSAVLVHFGDSDFLDRYQKYKAHLAEWKTQYPKLSSVDMRYDRQVVLEMQPGSSVPMAGAQAAEAAAAIQPKAVVPPVAKTAAPSVAAAHSVAAATHPALHAVAGTKPVAPATPTTAAPAAPTPQHLMVAKDVPAAKKPILKSTAPKKVAMSKAGAKKPAAKKPVAKKKTVAGQYHPPAVKP